MQFEKNFQNFFKVFNGKVSTLKKCFNFLKIEKARAL